MADWIARVTQGNVAEVKTVLTSVAFALAGYQVVLAAIGYGRLRPSAPGPAPAFGAHRGGGDR